MIRSALSSIVASTAIYLATSAAIAGGRFTTVLIEDAHFATAPIPFLNDAGDMALSLGLESASPFSDDPALYHYRDGTLTEVVKAGDQVFNESVRFLAAGTLNQTGKLAYEGAYVSLNDEFIHAWQSNTLLEIAQEGNGAAGFQSHIRHVAVFSPSIDDAGEIAFRSLVTGGAQALYYSGAVSTPLVASGGAAPSGSGFYAEFGTPYVSPGGALAFWASKSSTQQSGIDGEAIFADVGSNIELIAQAGQLAPTTGQFQDFRTYNSGNQAPPVNDSGEIVFHANLTNTPGGSADDSAIFKRTTGGTIVELIRRGQNVPGLTSPITAFFTNPMLNEAGTVAVSVSTPNNREGIYLSRDGVLQKIVAHGDPTPNGNAIMFNPRGGPALNDYDVVAYTASLSSPLNDRTLLLSDGEETILVAQDGDSLASETVDGFHLANRDSSGAGNNRSSLNNLGQIGFRADFLAGGAGTFLYTPDLRWRRDQSGDWQMRDNWTLGLPPAHVHNVSIDPDVDLTVVGPSSASVKQLTVGGAAGVATLNLNGGTVTAPDGVEFVAGGKLTGSGNIIGQLDLDGILQPVIAGTVPGSQHDRVEIDGDLTLGGLLQPLAPGGFVPMVGDRFEVLTTTGTITGQFASELLPMHMPNYQLDWDVDIGTSSVTLELTAVTPLSGDYNGNGIVDAADYTVWRDSRSSTGTGLPADGDGNGVIDSGDYLVWRNNFGAVPAGPGFSSTVPEPAGWISGVVCLLGLAYGRRIGDLR